MQCTAVAVHRHPAAISCPIPFDKRASAFFFGAEFSQFQWFEILFQWFKVRNDVVRENFISVVWNFISVV